MKILGINGSPRKNGTTGRLIAETLEATGANTELVHLGGKRISPCIACLACAQDNICKVKDAMQSLRPKLVEADAYIIGGATYYGMVNGLTHCFLERLYQFYHRGCDAIAGKPFIAVGTGGATGEPAAEQIKALLEYNRLEHFGSLTVQGVVSCFSCGFGENCEVGAIHRFFGPGMKITPDIIPSLEKQPEVVAQARKLGRDLAEHLRS